MLPTTYLAELVVRAQVVSIVVCSTHRWSYGRGQSSPASWIFTAEIIHRGARLRQCVGQQMVVNHGGHMVAHVEAQAPDQLKGRQ